MTFVFEIEAVSLAGFFQWCSVIDEKHGVVNGVFLAEFTEKYLRKSDFSCCFKLCVE